jgi:anti-sigma-K factor RskA
MSTRPDPADFVLGELQGEQLDKAHELMESDPTFRQDVEELSAVGDALAALPEEGWDPPIPPSFAAIEARQRASRSWWQSLLGPVRMPAPALALGAVALLVAGLGLGSWLSSSGDAGDGGQVIALDAIGDGDGSGRVLLASDNSGATLEVSGLAPSADDDFYELWLLTPPAELVSLGSFRVGADGSGTVSMPLPADLEDFEFLDVSVEPLDGDPGHSSVSVLRGSTT